MIVSDFTVATLSVYLGGFIRWGAPYRRIWEISLELPRLNVVAPLFGLLVVSLFALGGSYRPDLRWTFESEVVDVIKALLLIAVSTFSLLFWFKLQDTSRVMLALIFIVLGVGAIGARRALRTINSRRALAGASKQSVLMVGTGPSAEVLLERASDHPELGVQIVGYVDVEPRLSDLRYLGHLEDLAAVLADNVVDEVVFCLGSAFWFWLDPLTQICHEQGKTCHISVDIADHAFSSGTIQNFDGIPLLTLVSGPGQRLALALKRLIDLLGASAVLAILALPILFAGLAIWIDSGRPILFSQTRGGLQGRAFRALKFRTMVQDAEEAKADLMEANERTGPVFKIADDPRVTKFGRLLRKTSFDEIPQLVNVVRGEMSLVGPRPQPLEEVAEYDFWHRRRLSMKPGITGLWQINARNDPDFSRWMEYDLQYIDRWSVWLDFLILLRTPWALIRNPGT